MNGTARAARRVTLLAAFLAGCRPDGATGPEAKSPLPDLSGTWTYQATGLHIPGSGTGVCTVDSMTMEFGPWEAKGFGGRTSGGVLRCTGELGFLSGPLPSYPIVAGTMVLPDPGGYIPANAGFSISSQAGWRNEGMLAHDTVRKVVRGQTVVDHLDFHEDHMSMSGFVLMRTGGIAFDGNFRAVRIRRN